MVREGDTVSVNTGTLCRCDIPDQLMREMRSSIVFLGAVASRMGMAKLSFPGGCELGPRPIDLHLKALRQMGMVINEFHGYLDCTVPSRLKGGAHRPVVPQRGGDGKYHFGRGPGRGHHCDYQCRERA